MKALLRTVLILMSAGMLAACYPMLLAGAGAGGYYVGSDDRPVKIMTDDAGITTAVNLKYVDDPEVRAVDINVDTYDGVVTLYGTVPSQRVSARAEQLAYRVSGVKKVINKITVAGQ